MLLSKDWVKAIASSNTIPPLFLQYPSWIC